MTDEYLEYVLLDLSNRVGVDFSHNFHLELLPSTLQFKIRRTC
ncbi:hypothetical protein [Saccharolobus shibatae]|nr:hypothetical protein [Saccharolobus shibatae]